MTKNEVSYPLRKIHISAIRPIDSSQEFHTFEEANAFFDAKARMMWPGKDVLRTFAYTIEWDNQIVLNGTVSLSKDDAEDNRFFSHFVQETLELQANCINSYTKPQLMQVIAQPQWQMERLDFCDDEIQRASHILLHCEGFDSVTFSRTYERTQNVIQIIDEFHPLLKIVFPRAQIIRQEIQHLPNRSELYLKECLISYKYLVAAAVCAAVKDEETKFNESWALVQEFYGHIEQELKYTDERYTAIGRKLYHLSEADVSFLSKMHAYYTPVIEPLTNSEAQEFFERERAIMFVFNEPPQHLSDIERYQTIYAKKAFAEDASAADEERSRLSFTISTIRSFMEEKKISLAQMQQIISKADPFWVKTPSYEKEVSYMYANNACHLLIDADKGA